MAHERPTSRSTRPWPSRSRPSGRSRPLRLHLPWGQVLNWEPPARLELAWQIAPDRVPEPNPAKASELEVLDRYAATLR